MCMSTIEQKQSRGLRNTQFNSDMTVWNSPLCAWCLSEQDIAISEGSHGICTQHATQLLKQWRERRHHRNTAA